MSTENSEDLTLAPKGHTSKELTPAQKEIKGVWEAIHFVDKLAKNRRIPINEQTVIDIQKKVMGHFHPLVMGVYRDFDLSVADASFTPPNWRQVGLMMRDFGEELERRIGGLNHSFSGIQDVIRTAAWAHYELVKIHPFPEGNGRTSRMLVDLICKRFGLYYITDWGQRDSYISALENVNVTRDLGGFEGYIAGRLATRYIEISDVIHKSRVGSTVQREVFMGDFNQRRLEILKIGSVLKSSNVSSVK